MSKRNTNRSSSRMLENVINAITNLKETHGSTLRRIVNHIEASFRRGRGRRTDITPLVQEALTHGRETGIIAKHAQKYKVVTGSKSACGHCSKKRRRSRRRRRNSRCGKKSNKRRREASETNSEVSNKPSETASAEDGEVTEARGRRRSKRQANKRRRSKSRQREAQSSDDEDGRPEKDYQRNRKRRRRSQSRDDNRELFADEPVEDCDKSNCPCTSSPGNHDEKRDSDDDCSQNLMRY